MRATGNLRVKRGIWQMVFEYQDAEGSRRQKSESTGMPEKGNKRRAQQMLDKRDVMAHKIRENTLSQYKLIFNGYISKYEPFHGVKLQNITPALIQSFYNAELNAGLSPNTVRKHHANIHKCLDYAVRLGIIISNPSVQVKLPSKQKYMGAKAFTLEQTKDLLQMFQGDPLEVPVYLTATYDLRHSAGYALRKGGCDAKDIQA